MTVHAHRGAPAAHQAVSATSSGRRIDRLRRPGRARAGRGRRAPDAWAASRPSCRSTIPTATSGTPPRSAPPSASYADKLLRRLHEPLRAGRPAAPRAGQVVPGRAAAALGVLLLLPQGRRADLDATRRCSPTRPTRYGHGAKEAERVHARAGRAARRRRPATSSPATRTSSTTCGASAGCRSTSTRSTASSRTSKSARACAASSSRACSATVGYCLPLRPVWKRDQIALGERALVPARRAPVPASPATRRWATACRSTRCPGQAPGDVELQFRARSDGAAQPCCPRARRSAEPKPGKVGAGARAAQGMPAVPGVGQSAADLIRTALCVEPRDGIAARLHAAA